MSALMRVNSWSVFAACGNERLGLRWNGIAHCCWERKVRAYPFLDLDVWTAYELADARQNQVDDAFHLWEVFIFPSFR